MKVSSANTQIINRGPGSNSSAKPANVKVNSRNKSVRAANIPMKPGGSGKTAEGMGGACGAKLRLDTSTEKSIIRGLLI